jgi:hypothetical protein
MPPDFLFLFSWAFRPVFAVTHLFFTSLVDGWQIIAR